MKLYDILMKMSIEKIEKNNFYYEKNMKIVLQKQF